MLHKDLPELTYHIADQVSRKTAYMHRTIVEKGDVQQTLLLWALEHEKKIHEWAGEGDHGKHKLYRALINEARRYASRERKARSSAYVHDRYYYPIPVLEELLTQVWDEAHWGDTPSSQDLSGGRSSARPSETGDRISMLIDCKTGLERISDADRQILMTRYFFGGADISDMMTELDLTESGVRKRVSRALRRLQIQLGGEKPRPAMVRPDPVVMPDD